MNSLDVVVSTRRRGWETPVALRHFLRSDLEIVHLPKPPAGCLHCSEHSLQLANRKCCGAHDEYVHSWPVLSPFVSKFQQAEGFARAPRDFDKSVSGVLQIRDGAVELSLRKEPTRTASFTTRWSLQVF